MSTAIEPYNSDWILLFDEVRKSLDARLHHIEGITYHHIGSTSILGLPARPIIDILITAPESLSAAETGSQGEGQVGQVCNEPVFSKKYDKAPLLNKLHFSFAACDESSRPHTVSVCARNSLLARAHLAVRDMLREDAELREGYAASKTHALDVAKEAHPEKERRISAYAQAKTQALQGIIIASGQFVPSELAVIFASPPTARWDTISTQRLLLREYELSHTKGMFALEGNEENARYQDWPPWTHARARQTVLQGIRDSYSQDRTVVELAVVHEGEFIGRIGGRVKSRNVLLPPSLANVSLATPEGELEVKEVAEHIDLWYSFLPSSQGKGLATEAMKAFVAVLVKKEKLENEPLELEIECDPRNIGSWKMAERLGFEKSSLTEQAWETNGEWVDSLVYRKIV